MDPAGSPPSPVCGGPTIPRIWITLEIADHDLGPSRETYFDTAAELPVSWRGNSCPKSGSTFFSVRGRIPFPEKGGGPHWVKFLGLWRWPSAERRRPIGRKGAPLPSNEGRWRLRLGPPSFEICGSGPPTASRDHSGRVLKCFEVASLKGRRACQGAAPLRISTG